MGKDELRDHGRERKESRQIQTRCYLYTVWMGLEPYDDYENFRRQAGQEYNPDAIQWSMSGEWPGRKEPITEEKEHGKMTA